MLEPGFYTVPTGCVDQITILSGVTLPRGVEVSWEVAPPNACCFCLFPKPSAAS